jgi:lipopolysaccharide transport system permease protein
MGEKRIFRIERRQGWALQSLSEVWPHRDLLWLLVQRDIKLRYRQTGLGVIWVVLQPLIPAVIFTVVFGRLAQMPSDGTPYLLFVFSSLLGWNLLAGSIARAGNSLVAHASLLTKVYFPRILIPIAGGLGVFVDLAVSLLLLVALLFYHGVGWHGGLLTAPLFLALIFFVATGVSLWLSALSVYYRDFVYVAPFMTQVWMYMSPVVFPVSIVPERWRVWYAFNPMVSGLEGLRWSILGRANLTIEMLVVSSVAAVVLFLSSLVFFERVQRSFADVI